MKTWIQTVLALAALASAAPIFDEVEDRNTTLFHRTDAPNGEKKGIAYNNPVAAMAFARSNSASWAYNWGTAEDCPSQQGIPMCRDRNCRLDAIWGKVNKGNTPYVLGFNEPDMPFVHGGSDITWGDAYSAWAAMFSFANAGVKLVCPGISSYETETGLTGGPSGLIWLRKFVRAQNNPDYLRCSAQAIHWYGESGRSAAYQADLFKQYVARARTEVNSIFGKEMPLWITEFAAEPRQDQQLQADFLRIVVPWMDGQSYIHRYAPFFADWMVELPSRNLKVSGQTYVDL